jgi:hypothetical protein
VGKTPVKYICDGEVIEYVLLSHKNKKKETVYLVLGNAEELLDRCKSIMSKLTGEVE